MIQTSLNPNFFLSRVASESSQVRAVCLAQHTLHGQSQQSRQRATNHEIEPSFCDQKNRKCREVQSRDATSPQKTFCIKKSDPGIYFATPNASRTTMTRQSELLSQNLAESCASAHHFYLSYSQFECRCSQTSSNF